MGGDVGAGRPLHGPAPLWPPAAPTRAHEERLGQDGAVVGAAGGKQQVAVPRLLRLRRRVCLLDRQHKAHGDVAPAVRSAGVRLPRCCPPLAGAWPTRQHAHEDEGAVSHGGGCGGKQGRGPREVGSGQLAVAQALLPPSSSCQQLLTPALRLEHRVPTVEGSTAKVHRPTASAAASSSTSSRTVVAGALRRGGGAALPSCERCHAALISSGLPA